MEPEPSKQQQDSSDLVLSTGMSLEQVETTVEDDTTIIDQTVHISVSDNEGLIELNVELEKILDIKNTLSTPPPAIIMNPLECRIMQSEEMESLKAIFDDDMTPLNNDYTCFSVDIKYLSEENISNDDVIKIWFSLPTNYPSVPPVFEIEANRSGTFTFNDADELFDILMKGAIDRLGEIMIYDLITICQEQLTAILDKRKQEHETRLHLDEERRKQIELDDALKSKKGFIPSSLWPAGTLVDETSGTGGAESLETGVESTILMHRYRSNHHPREFLGSINSIIKKLPQNLQITRIENILRQDLAERFVDCQKTMIKDLWKKQRQSPMQYSLTPEIAFPWYTHQEFTINWCNFTFIVWLFCMLGLYIILKLLPHQPHPLLLSLVQHGLVIPGANNNPITVRCGSSFGKGIYLSPAADFSLGYTDSCRLIVCAVLRGVKWHGHVGLRNPGRFFTVVSSSEYEWVFFNPAQVLPCYVIQIHQLNVKPDKVSIPPPLVGVVNTTDEDDNIQKTKEKLQARARKYLPFGFGPGDKTVILECGEIDDDEEDYGDYQLLRYNQTDEYESNNKTAIEHETELQHYRTTEDESL